MPLPDCHSRHPLPDEEEYFLCSHPNVHMRGRLAHVGICQLCDHWREAPPPHPVDLTGKVRTGSCLYLGGQIGETSCPTCRGNVRLKVYRCDHPRHRETTLTECRVCEEYEPT